MREKLVLEGTDKKLIYIKHIYMYVILDNFMEVVIGKQIPKMDLGGDNNEKRLKNSALNNDTQLHIEHPTCWVPGYTFHVISFISSHDGYSPLHRWETEA